MGCPNKQSAEWRSLVDTVGEDIAYQYFIVDPELMHVDEFIAEHAVNPRLFVKTGFANATAEEDYEVTRAAVTKANTNLGAALDDLIAKANKIDPNIESKTITRDILNEFRVHAKKDGEERIRDQAEREFKGLTPDATKIFFEINPTVGLTKDEYIATRLEETNTNALRGTLLHKALIYALVASESEQNKLLKEMQEDVKELRGETATLKSYNWAYTDPKYVRRITEMLELDILEDKPEDKYTFELKLKSETLGITGVLDMIIHHGDNVFTIVDFKTSPTFGRLNSSAALKDEFYKGLTRDITDNPKEMAKLQLTWYALLTRINNPQATFRALRVAHIPNKAGLYTPQINMHVDIENFLPMIEKFIKTTYPREYELLTKADPHLFNQKVYRAHSARARKAVVAKTKENQVLEDIGTEIQYLALNPKSKDAKEKGIVELVNLYNSVAGDKNQLSLEHLQDLSFGEFYLGNLYNIKNPLIKLWLKAMTPRIHAASRAWELDRAQFNVVYGQILKDYIRHRNIGGVEDLLNKPADALSEALPVLKSVLGTVNPAHVDGWAYVDDTFGGRGYKRLATTEEEINTKDYPWIMENGKVKAHYLQLLKLLNTKYASILDAKDPNSYWNSRATRTVGFDGTLIDIKVGETVNSSVTRKNSPYEYRPGDFPRIAKLRSEFKAFSAFGDRIKNSIKQYFTDFYELNYQEYMNNTELIPLKGLRSNYNDNPQDYSLSLEHQFESFMKNAYWKKEMTDIYALGKALTMFIGEENSGDNPYLPQVEKWIQTQLEFSVRGRKPLISNSFSRALPLKFMHTNADDKDVPIIYNFNLAKFISNIGKVSAYTYLGFNVFGGLRNAMFINMYTLKESAKQNLIKKWVNDPQRTKWVNDYTTIGVGEFTKGFFSTGLEMQKDAMRGNLSSNKVWRLMQRYNYVPSISPYRSESRHYQSASYSWLSTDFALLPYSLGEEVLVSSLFGAQLRHAKVTKKGPFEGTSIWDMYDEVEVTDPTTGITYKDYQWKKDPTTGKPFVRGVYLDNLGNVVEMTEPDSREIDTMHALYEEMQGGFATMDRTILEATVIGDLFLQFKRFLPTILRNGLQSHGPSYTKGKYQPLAGSDKKIEGYEDTPEYEFIAKNVEGRWITVLGMLMHYASLRSLTKGNSKLSNAMGKVFPKGTEEYAFSKLDQGQLENLLDLGVSTTMWGMMNMLSYLAMGGVPDDNKAKRLTERLMADFMQQWNPTEVSKDVLGSTQPAAFKLIHNMVSSGFDLTSSIMLWGADRESQALNKNNEFRGWNQFSQSVPLLNSVNRNIDVFEDIIELSDEETP